MKSLDISGLTHEQWLEERRKGIGGSDAAAVCGMSRYKSPFEVWLDKTGQGKPVTPNEKMYWGTRLEDIIREEFEKRTGKTVEKPQEILIHPEHDFLLANVDGLIEDEHAGLECKACGKYFNEQWTDTEFPQEYYIQCCHYMLVTGAEKWYLAALLNGNEFKIYTIERDEELLQTILEMELKFWEYVKTGEVPPMDGSASCTEVLSEMFSETKDEPIRLPNEVADLIKEYYRYKDLLKEAEYKKTEIENKVKFLLGSHESGYCDGVQVTWKPVVSNRLDTKRLKEEDRETYDRFVRETSSRRFSIKEV